jgi:hypothetical protein
MHHYLDQTLEGVAEKTTSSSPPATLSGRHDGPRHRTEKTVASMPSKADTGVPTTVRRYRHVLLRRTSCTAVRWHETISLEGHGSAGDRRAQDLVALAEPSTTTAPAARAPVSLAGSPHQVAGVGYFV